jgi:protein TonB
VKHRFFNSLLITVLLYATVGFLLLYTLNHTIGTEQKPKEKVVSFSLSEYEPKPVPLVEEPILEEPIIKKIEPVVEEKKVEPEPEPIVEEIKPEHVVEKVVPKAKPIVKKKIKKKIVKKIKKKKRTVKKKHVVQKKKRIKKVVKKKNKKRTTRKNVSSKSNSSPAKKNKFANRLRGRINSHKKYPRIAQRRGMQGSVKVKFTILLNGNVSNIRVTGKKVFHKSARKAVEKSFPMNVKNAPFSFPYTFNLTLRYQIK